MKPFKFLYMLLYRDDERSLKEKTSCNLVNALTRHQMNYKTKKTFECSVFVGPAHLPVRGTSSEVPGGAAGLYKGKEPDKREQYSTRSTSDYACAHFR